MTAIDLSANLALVALAVATLNVCLGLLIAVRYNPLRSWPYRRINIFKFHNWTAYLLLAVILLHPLMLLFSTRFHWRLFDLVFPLWSPVERTASTFGAVSLYLVLVVIGTSYFRQKLGRVRWKLFHYLVYAAAVSIFTHALIVDPKFKNSRFDPLDGEKFFVECCLFVMAVAAGWAWQYRIRKTRRECVLGVERYQPIAAAESE